jgi:mono/diheme cytochrome c family protein
MKKLSSIGLLIATLSLMCSLSAWAADGSALYKSKCAQCHGANGEGKPALKAPALKGTTKSEDELVTLLSKGDPQRKAPHSKSFPGMDEAQAKALAEYVKSLK